MSEQKVSFMQQLDNWTDEAVIAPLVDGGGVEAQLQVRKAIREKVLESYRNGCKAGAGHVRGEYRQAESQAKGYQPRRQSAK